MAKAGRDMETLGRWCPAGGLERTARDSGSKAPPKTKTTRPVVALLGVHPRERKRNFYPEACSSMFMTALNCYKQPKT